MLNWAADALNARFIQVQGVMFTEQPRKAIAAARAEIPADPWRLSAVSSVTTLTGSVLMALALAAGAFDARRGVGCGARRRRLADVAMGPRRGRARAPRLQRETDFHAAVLVLKHT